MPNSGQGPGRVKTPSLFVRNAAVHGIEKVILRFFEQARRVSSRFLAPVEANDLLLRSYTAMAAMKGLAPKMLITRVKL